jgi:hypothetical protein
MSFQKNEVVRDREWSAASEQHATVPDHVFHVIKHIGQSGEADWKTRTVSIAVAVLICLLLYGGLYFAMRVND